MKKIISMLLVITLCFYVLPFSAFAQNSVDEYTNDEKKAIYLKYTDNEHMLDALFNSDKAIAYWSMVNDTEKNGLLKWCIDKSAQLIGEYPDKRDYAKILANLIMMQSGDIANQVQNQSQFDELKDGVDYVMDVVKIAESFIGGAELLETISPIIDAATGGAEVIVENQEQAKYYETSIRDYSETKLFLDAIAQYANNNELKDVANSLLKANDILLEKRLEYLADVAGSLAEYEAEFFVENMNFALLKNADLYETDETVKWYVDSGEKIANSIQSIFAAGKFAFRMTMLAGNIGFGTADTFNRYQEMKIVADVAGAIVKANSKISVPQGADVDSVLTNIQTKCNYYKMLISTHARGEYLIYQLLVNDAGLLSDFRVLFDYFKEPGETTDDWYTRQVDCMADYYDILERMFEVSDINMPDNAMEFNGHYYYVYNVDSITNWNAAQEYCEQQGGYLATITSEEEDAFVYAYMLRMGYHSAMFGLSDQEQTDDWKWVTGEEFSYRNWYPGEPNHQGGYEHYGMYYKNFVDGSWNDGSGQGGPFICEWGEYTPAVTEKEPIQMTSSERDIVLALDVSGSMDGTPLDETKKASSNFIETVLQKDASIGVVTYNSGAERSSAFSADKTALERVVSEISSGGGTNIEVGLQEAADMLQTSRAKKKIIVLMSDGEPNDGKQGDELVRYADEIKKSGVYIYTLGFFSSLGDTKSAAQILMEQIASDGCHYEVANADDLVFFFGDMADQINGQKYIYVRIACPVDVTVTYQGQTLSSAEDDLNLRTDFGTLTFEENDTSESDAVSAQADDRIKVLRLKEGEEYDVKINGTGQGLMNYTIGFMDDAGDYTDLRQFENIKITKRTSIDTVAAVAEESILNIDENGDGKYDLRLRATENGYGEEMKPNYILYIGAGSGAIILLIIIVVVIHKARKKRKAKVK